jgi:hypothetical protein
MLQKLYQLRIYFVNPELFVRSLLLTTARETLER